MAYEICKICDGMFEQNGKIYCDRCFKKDKEDYEILIEYIKANPNHTILELMGDTGLKIKTINRFVENGSVAYNKKGVLLEHENY